MHGTRPKHIGAVVADDDATMARWCAIQPFLRSSLTAFSHRDLADADLGDALRIQLPRTGEDTWVPAVVDHTLNGALGRSATARLVVWMRQEVPDLVVIDGCPDAALLARLCGIPFVVVRGRGSPTALERDVVHLGAAGLLAPYPAALEAATTPADVRQRTVYAGLISRPVTTRGGRSKARDALGIDRKDRVVAVIDGSGEPAVDPDMMAVAATASAGWRWHVVGAFAEANTPRPGNLRVADPDADPTPYLQAADVVIATPSLRTVSDVAALRRPLLLLPDDPTSAEEAELLRLLGSVGAAVPLLDWPPASAWPALLSSCVEMPFDAQAQLCDGRGPQRAADWLDAWAATPPHHDGDGLPVTGPRYDPAS